MTEEVSHCDGFLHLLFSPQQLACQLQALFLMEMAEPGDPKRVKTPFCRENGSQDGNRGGGETTRSRSFDLKGGGCLSVSITSKTKTTPCSDCIKYTWIFR